MADEIGATPDEFRAITGVDHKKMPDASGVAVTPEKVQSYRQSVLDKARKALGIESKPKAGEPSGSIAFGVATDATPKTRVNPDDAREAVEDKAEAEARAKATRDSI